MHRNTKYLINAKFKINVINAITMFTVNGGFQILEYYEIQQKLTYKNQ